MDTLKCNLCNKELYQVRQKHDCIGCADCSPMNFRHKHDGQTVPICDYHFHISPDKKPSTTIYPKCMCATNTFCPVHSKDIEEELTNIFVDKEPPKSTDDKIVDIVRFALQDGDSVRLFRVAEILNKRAEFENKLREIMKL